MSVKIKNSITIHVIRLDGNHTTLEVYDDGEKEHQPLLTCTSD